MLKDSKIYVAGHRGLVGSAILEKLKEKGYNNFVLRTHSELDLKSSRDVREFFKKEKPEYVFLAAAKVGGIIANDKYRGDFIYENLMIQNNVIHESYLAGTKKLLFLGSTCIYPKNCAQPIKEEYLLTDVLEYTNEPYAIAKIAGIKMCESYNIQYGTNNISVMPTNLYGPNDNFDLENSHVLPALINKMHLAKLLSESRDEKVAEIVKKKDIKEAKEYLQKFSVSGDSVEIWGSGKPRREFLWSEDMAEACIHIMEKCDFKNMVHIDSSEIRNTHINIGTGKDISIEELALLIKKVVGFKGELKFNLNKPDGTMRKLTDVSKLNSMGWKHSVELNDGIHRLYNWYLKSLEDKKID